MTTRKNLDVAVVVVNYGSSSLLEKNLAPLSSAFSVVVVDNFSDLPERHAVNALALREGWESLLLDENSGFGAGMNCGVARAIDGGAKAVLLLNPDAQIEPSAVEALYRLVSASPETMVAPRILRPDGSVWSEGSDLYLDDGRIRSRRRRPENATLSAAAPAAGIAVPTGTPRIEEWLSGACLMLTRDLWQRAGGFDDDYFLYWEDVDLSHRVIAAGGRLAVADDVTAVHAEGGTQQEGRTASGEAKSRTYYFYNIRNRLLYGARHLSTPDLRAWRAVAWPIAWEVLLQGGRRQFVRSPGTLVTGLRAVRAGLRIVDTELDRRARSSYSGASDANPNRAARKPLS